MNAPDILQRKLQKNTANNTRNGEIARVAPSSGSKLDQIRSTRFNQELKRLDAPDARWTRYRGPSGTDYAHPIAMHEQAQLLEKVGIHSIKIRPPGAKKAIVRIGNRTLAVYSKALRHRGKIDLGSVSVVPICAFSMPRLRRAAIAVKYMCSWW